MPSAPDKNASARWGWWALAAFLPVFLAAGFARLIDADEGYVLLAAKLVSSGHMPYRDFFFPQGPLTALAYAPVATWHAGRALSALAAATTGALLVAHLRGRVPARIVVFAALAYGANALALAWFPVVKTYALATAALYAAHVLASRAGRGWLRAVLVGALCAATIAGRTYLAVAVPFVLVSLFSAAGSKGRSRLLGATLAMAITGGLFAVPALAAPASALYSTIGYHLSRTGSLNAPVMTGMGSMRQKWDVIQQLLLVLPGERAAALQLLLVGATIAVGGRAGRRSQALRIALSIVAASMLLSPTHVQYLCAIVPFAIEAAALGMPQARTGRRYAVAAIGAAAYAIAAIADVDRFAVTGRDVPGVNGMPDGWRIASVIDTSARISAVAGRSAVLSSWPGYLVESSASPWPGTENHFAFAAGDAVPEASKRRAYHLVSTDDAIGLLRDRKVPVLVLGNWKDEIRSALRDEDAAHAHGYVTCARGQDVAIFALANRCPDGMDERGFLR
jgi:hypothetical protein